jgi:hypothetical protein
VIVPVIGVFTKYDKLITRLERIMDPSRRAGLNKEQLSKLAEEDAERALKNISIDPFEGSVDKEEVPLVHVSSLSKLLCSLVCHTSDIRTHSQPGT